MGSLFASTNVRVTAAALLLLVVSASATDLIPVRQGAGYDGIHYVRWTQHLSVEVLFSPPSERPQGVTVSTYSVRRVLLPMALHYTLRALSVRRTLPNVIATYKVANIILLSLAVLLWCMAADEIGVGDRGKWLGLSALIVSYVNWKMPIFYPALTDSAAVALGTAMLLCYLRGRQLGLAVLSLAGGFVWPSLPYFGLLLVAFPRERLASFEPAPARLNRIAAAGAAALALAYILYLVRTGYDIRSSSVEPIWPLLSVSAGLVALYLYLALAPLLDSRAFWQDIVPWRVLGRGWFWISLLVFALGPLIIRSLDLTRVVMGAEQAVADNFMTSIHQPGIFVVAHALHYGPLVLLLLFLWKPMSESVRRQGTGLVLCFVLAILLGAGSESRKLMNFYPVIVLFLAQAAEPIFASGRRLVAAFALSALFSKIWLPMSGPIDLPWIGALEWRALYASSRGPWIDEYWWAAQAVPLLAVAALFYVWCRRGASAASSAPS